jgi:hypothetical protein
MKGYRRIFFLLLMSVPGALFAQDKNSRMSDAAREGQKMQNKLYPQIQLPFSYNYNQKIGSNNGSQQNEFAFQPIVPIKLGTDFQLLLNPMLTFNRNNNFPQAINQLQPLQLATFFAPRVAGDWYFGIGPYYQAPASSALNGSRQTGLGVSAGAFYTPENWVMGVAMYNSWGIGGDLSGGSANILNAQPTISYTTNDGWTYSFSSQINFDYVARNTTNQLTFSGGKTVKVMGRHWQFQIGPTYMISEIPSSAKGWGVFFGLTTSIPP